MSDIVTLAETGQQPERELPSGWVWTTLGEIQLDKSTAIVPNKTPDVTFELYSVPSFDTGQPEIVPGSQIGSNKQVVEEDVVLLCKINPRINRVWVVGNRSSHKKIASTEWIPFYKVEGIAPKYLGYFMRTNTFKLSVRSFSTVIAQLKGRAMPDRAFVGAKASFESRPSSRSRVQYYL